MKRNSGVANDDSVNVMHFDLGAQSFILDAQADAIAGRLSAFYGSFASYLSMAVDRDVDSHQVDFAYVNTGGVGVGDDSISPIIESRRFSTIGAAGIANAIPSECAIVLSLRGNIIGVPEELGGTRPRSNRRGRMYLGPWNTSALTQSTGNACAISSALAVTIGDAYGDMVTALNALTAPIRHVVYSPTTDSAYAVQSWHIDNAFDTLRSRGDKATGRTVGTVTQATTNDGVVTGL